MALKEAAFRIFSLKVQFPLCNSATHWTVRGGTRKRVAGSQPCRSTAANTHHQHGHCMFMTREDSFHNTASADGHRMKEEEGGEGTEMSLHLVH